MKKMALFLVSLFMLVSCIKDSILLPVVTTSNVILITEYSAKVQGEIINDGGSILISYGICYGTDINPEISGTEITIPVYDSLPVNESIEINLNNLIPNTTYFVKAYAGNKNGMSYGEQISFTTGDGPISKNIRSIAVDTKNNIWCGTDKGLAKYDGAHWTNYTTVDGLINKNVNVVVVDKLGALWIGTEGGLSHFDGSNWTNFTMSDGLARDEITALALHPMNNNLLIGTGGNGISGYNGSFTAYFVDASVSMGTLGHIHTLCYDKDENVWIGSCLTGLSMTDGFNWEHNINGLNSFVMASLCASDGSLWFGTALGVYKFFDNIWTYYSVSDGLVNNDITAITEGKDGKIWFGSTNGISSFNGSVFSNYTVENGIISNTISDLAIDPDGNLWVATEMGISKINYEDMR